MEESAKDLKKRRGRAYVKAALLGTVLGFCLYIVLIRWLAPPLTWTVGYGVNFEWDSTRGFKSFRLKDNAIGDRLGGRLWQYLIAAQVKAFIGHYLRQNGMQHVTGSAGLAVFRIIPLAYPDSLGSGGLSLEDPDEPPLMRAADEGDLNSVRKLLREGANVNAKDQWGATALLHACARRKTSADVVRALLDAGADANAGDRWGGDPLHAAYFNASREDRPAVIRELVAHGANVNARDEYGGTLLMVAAAYGDVEKVKILLAAGADANVRDNEGGTALSVAQQRGHTEIVRLLKQSGAHD